MPSIREVPSHLNYYEPDIFQDIVTHTYVDRVNPQSGFEARKSGTLKFLIKGNESFIDLRRSYINFKLRITGSGKDDKDETHDASYAKFGKTGATVINAIGQTIFKDCRAKLGTTVVSDAGEQYGFKVVQQIMTGAVKDSQDVYFLGAIGWVKDKAGQMDAPITATSAGNAACENPAMIERRKMFGTQGNPVAEIVMKPHTGLTMLDKYIPPFIDVEIELTRHDNPNFYMFSSLGNHNFDLEIEDPVYEVRRYLNSTSYVANVERMIVERPITLRLTDGHINTITIPANVRNYTVENLFHGNVPKKITFAMVSVDNFNGHREKNPFNFQHFDISHMRLLKNGQEYPYPECKTDFSSSPPQFLATWHRMMMSFNSDYNDHCVNISPSEYANGYFFYSFYMAPDQESGWELHQIPSGPSQVRLELTFGTALAKSVQLIVFYESDSIVTIDNLRRVSVVHQ